MSNTGTLRGFCVDFGHKDGGRGSKSYDCFVHGPPLRYVSPKALHDLNRLHFTSFTVVIHLYVRMYIDMYCMIQWNMYCHAQIHRIQLSSDAFKGKQEI